MSWSHAESAPNNAKPAVSSGFCEADEGTRTLDLLHGKDRARSDRSRPEPTIARSARLLTPARRLEASATDSQTLARSQPREQASSSDPPFVSAGHSRRRPRKVRHHSSVAWARLRPPNRCHAKEVCWHPGGIPPSATRSRLHSILDNQLSAAIVGLARGFLAARLIARRGEIATGERPRLVLAFEALLNAIRSEAARAETVAAQIESSTERIRAQAQEAEPRVRAYVQPWCVSSRATDW